MAAQIIPLDRFDRRAVHRIFSEPVALELSMNVDALSQEVVTLCHNAHFQALGTGNESLVNVIRLIGSKVTHIRRIAQEATELASQSEAVDPYKALELAHIGPDAA